MCAAYRSARSALHPEAIRIIDAANEPGSDLVWKDMTRPFANVTVLTGYGILRWNVGIIKRVVERVAEESEAASDESGSRR